MAARVRISNLLLQRVRRHASMTTLFRAVDPNASWTPRSERQPVQEGGIVQASLPIPPPGSAGPSVPVSSPPAARSTPQVFRSSDNPPAPLPPPAARQEPAPIPAPAKPEEEATWRRLETIFRKHAEQDGPEKDSPEPDPGVPEMNSPDAPAVNKDFPDAETPLFTVPGGLGSSLPPVQRAVDPTSPHAQEPAAPSRTAGEAPQSHTEDRPHAPRAGQPPADRVESPPVQPSESTLPQPTQPLAAPLSGVESVEKKLAGSTPVPPLENGPQAAAPVEAPRSPFIPAARPPIPGVSEDSESSEAPQPLQPVPLEAVWPVQRKLAENAPEDKRAGAGDPDPQFHPLQPLALPPAENSFSPEPVPPRRASDTPIEIVLPRSPRPAPLGLMKTAQRQIEPPQGPEEPAFLPGEVSPIAAPPAEQPAASLRSNPAPAGTIPTQVGPLPADLWDLIGEKPPQPEMLSEEQQSQEPSRAPDRIQANAASEATAASQRAVPVPANPGTAFIQRKLEEGPRPTETVQPAVAPPAGPAAEKTTERAPEPAGKHVGEPKIDVDDLARQVYSELKRRLAVEMERLRRD